MQELLNSLRCLELSIYGIENYPVVRIAIAYIL